MITPNNAVQYVDNVSCVQTTYCGLSADTKPTTGIANGSVFIEMDTSKLYFFDSANSAWREWGGA